MERFASATTLDMWYYHVDADAVQTVFDVTSSKQGRRRAEKMIAKARTKTQQQTLKKITSVENGTAAQSSPIRRWSCPSENTC